MFFQGDLGAIDDKYDVAISTACGALDNIVCDSIDTAQRCISFLKQSNIGSATFIGLDKVHLVVTCFFNLLYIEWTWFSVIGGVHVVGRATSWWYKLPCLVSSFGTSSSCPTCWDRLGSPSYSRLLYLYLYRGIHNLVVSCSWELLGVVLVIHLAHPVSKISSQRSIWQVTSACLYYFVPLLCR